MVANKIKLKIVSLVKRILQVQEPVSPRSPYSFIQNINLNIENKLQKKVLISYITDPFNKNIEGKIFHTNQKEAIQILYVFIKNNYAVDICHCLEEIALPEIAQKKYDLIFGFGKPFLEACIANKNAFKIIYCTEAYPDFVKKQEQSRLNYYHERYGKKINVSRHGKFYLPEQFTYANYLLFKGNKVTEASFPELPGIKKKVPIAPAPFVNLKYVYRERAIATTKNQFIWFGSFGAVHKGLDILVDVFAKHSEWKLIVCGLWKSEIEILPQLTPNIIIKGFMDTNSDEFIEMVDSSSFVVLSTCSEGMSSGVLTCMSHGLIPIVSKESGIDLTDEGLYFDDYKLPSIENKLIEWSNKEDEALLQLHKKIFTDSRNNYNLGVFTKCFEEFINQIV
jgi:hypothetical protein